MFPFPTVKGYTRKGLAYLAMKQFSQAQSAYQKALELDENNKASCVLFVSYVYLTNVFLFSPNRKQLKALRSVPCLWRRTQRRHASEL